MAAKLDKMREKEILSKLFDWTQEQKSLDSQI
jgi:hypothetical protein